MDPAPARAPTFLFTDVEGSTRLWEEFPEGMRGAIRRHDSILRTAIEATGGLIVKTTGDGVMAVFHDAADAITASIRVQRDLAAEPWEGAVPLRVRMGIHTGTADERGGDFFGPTINRTARIMGAGHGGQIGPAAGATMLPELHLLKGDLLAAMAADSPTRRDVAERWYRGAFDRAVELDARMTRLRAAMRLARLHQEAGEPDAAAAVVGPAYASFTEGFDTADLREARNLLDQVSWPA